MKGIAVVGSTGSIGSSTLSVIEAYPERFRVVSLAAGRQLDRLRLQIETHRPALVSVADKEAADALALEFPWLTVAWGAEGLVAAACADGADMVVAALVGSLGLESTVAAIRAGRDIALANKETLVVAGDLVTAEVARAGVRLLPVDSEHNAIHQALSAGSHDAVRRLLLTASGGPFRSWSAARIRAASVQDALAHPTWKMGPKISIDSATMMNKGLEIIEASHLFAMPHDRIDVVVHPQSLVHSLVEYIDGTLIAQLSVNDMRFPILYALAWPERLQTFLEPLDLVAAGRLDFAAPDDTRFPALRLARSALGAGGEMPAVLNAANEVAVEHFLAERCGFARIAETVEQVLERWSARNRPLTSLEQARHTDCEARRIAASLLSREP